MELVMATQRRPPRMFLLATTADLIALAAAIDSAMELKYVDTWSRKKTRPIYRSLSEIPDLGLRPQGRKCDGARVLAMRPSYPIAQSAYSVKNRKTQAWDLDYERMPDTVDIDLPGAMVRERTLLDGEIVAVSHSPGARKIYQGLTKAVRRVFSRVNATWIGPEALELARSGWRCTPDVESPPEYDISI